MPYLCPYVFVYGSLQRGGPPQARAPLQADGRRLGSGSVPGRLYMAEGWPAAVVIPGCRERVHGEVYALGHPARTLAALDAWEGEFYIRGLTLVDLDDKNFALGSWIWTWAGPLDEKKRIPGGRWSPQNFQDDE